MRIAVISEVSARDKNGFILEALSKNGLQTTNLGMSAGDFENELTYIHTGLMAAISLNTGAADFVVGGCGTGQGFLLSAMQYPGVFCGLITNPLDAWLFSQINAGNCVSLALNKGFGWAGELELCYIFEKLFSDPAGQGFPPHRSESQRQSREKLADISRTTHRELADIVCTLDSGILQTVCNHGEFTGFIERYGEEGQLRDMIIKGGGR